MNECLRIRWGSVFVCIMLMLCLSDSLFGQMMLNRQEEEINILFQELAQNIADEKKLSVNSDIRERMRMLLTHEESFSYPFDSLKYMGKVLSPDGSFRLYCWNIVLTNGSYRYYTFIQHSKKESGCRVEELFDREDTPDNCMMITSRANDWLGALYYQIIPFKNSGKDYYLLLGWDGNNISTNKKVIEVLYFDNERKAVFGAPVINWRDKRLNRVVFEYAKQARMTLRYDMASKRVIFDHLSPMSPNYKGQFEYYGPDFSYDALILKKGVWILEEDVDIRKMR